MTAVATITAPPTRGFTKGNASALGKRAAMLKRARNEVLKDLGKDGTVCRDKMARAVRLILGRMKPTAIQITNVKDLAALTGVADTIFGWSASSHSSRHEHLHMHTVDMLQDSYLELQPDTNGPNKQIPFPRPTQDDHPGPLF